VGDFGHNVKYGNTLILTWYNNAAEFHKLCHGVWQNLPQKNGSPVYKSVSTVRPVIQDYGYNEMHSCYTVELSFLLLLQANTALSLSVLSQICEEFSATSPTHGRYTAYSFVFILSTVFCRFLFTNVIA